MMDGIERAIELLDATDEGNGFWRYYAWETNSWWQVHETDLRLLEEMIENGVEQPYSEWCSITICAEIGK